MIKKLEKKSSETLSKGSGIEDSDKESNQRDESKEKYRAKKDHSLGSMSVEHIQNLITNAIKVQLEGGSDKTHLYTKSYTKRIVDLHMPQYAQ